MKYCTMLPFCKFEDDSQNLAEMFLDKSVYVQYSPLVLRSCALNTTSLERKSSQELSPTKIMVFMDNLEPK